VIYFPDTNAFSAHLRGTSPALSTRMVEALEAGELRFSIVVFLELAYGARKAELAGEKRPAARVAKLGTCCPSSRSRNPLLRTTRESGRRWSGMVG
jgi:predicted nucleic acid-binding protein